MLLHRLLLGVTAALCSPLAMAEGMRVQADQWCPYNCDPAAAQPGYVVEMLRTVFDKDPAGLEYSTMPWRRALTNTREGRADALIGITRENATRHGFIVGREPVGLSTDCVLVLAEHPLQATQVADLEPLQRIGIAADYEYTGTLGAWIADPRNSARFVITRDELPGATNLRNLARGMLEGVIEDRSVAHWLLKLNHLEERARVAWCDRSDPVFVAFSGKSPQAQSWARQLDLGIAEMRRNGGLAKLMARYGLKDWAAR